MVTCIEPIDSTPRTWCARQVSTLHRGPGRTFSGGIQSSKRINEYELIEVLGNGSFGTVYRAMRCPKGTETDINTLRQFAVKVIEKDRLKRIRIFHGASDHSHSMDNLGRLPVGSSEKTIGSAYDRVQLGELGLHKRLFHRHIPILYEIIDDDSCNKLYSVEEFIEKGCIHWSKEPITNSIINAPLDINQATNFTLHILLALRYLHARRIAHRDVKPSNCLISSKGQALLADFGYACCSTDERIEEPLDQSNQPQPVMCSDSPGTIAFSSPESLSGELYDATKADMWAVGVLFYVMLADKLPFAVDSSECDIESPMFMITSIRSFDTDRLLKAIDMISDRFESMEQQLEVTKFFEKCFAVDPVNRLTARDAICDPVFMTAIRSYNAEIRARMTSK